MKKGADDRQLGDIAYGMVVDHVPLELVENVYGVLKEGIPFDGKHYNMFLGDVDSENMGIKGIVKIHGLHMNESDKALYQIGLIAPDATVNWIANSKVKKKQRARNLLPKEIDSDIIDCENPNCVSHTEAPGKYELLKNEPIEVKCHYCREPKRLE